MSPQFGSSHSQIRDLKCLQAFMLQLETGAWSGFKREMEIAESSLQPLATVSAFYLECRRGLSLIDPPKMLRRGGAFSRSTDSPALAPLASDTPEELETKWNKFITRESYKRYINAREGSPAERPVLRYLGLRYTCFCTTSKRPSPTRRGL